MFQPSDESLTTLIVDVVIGGGPRIYQEPMICPIFSKVSPDFIIIIIIVVVVVVVVAVAVVVVIIAVTIEINI